MRIESTECGLAVDVPDGWNARIWNRLTSDPSVVASNALHAATFTLPSEDGTFGDQAVRLIKSGDIFTALAERGGPTPYEGIYAPSSVPEKLRLEDFGSSSMQLPLPGLIGCQYFLTLEARPFCLYVVSGGSIGLIQYSDILLGMFKTLTVTPASVLYQQSQV
jgi:hypothetical protein